MLTREQFRRDCDLVVAVFGHEACSKFWRQHHFRDCTTYQEACMYWAWVFADGGGKISDAAIRRVMLLRHRDTLKSIEEEKEHANHRAVSGRH